jgi:hypothetical protein
VPTGLRAHPLRGRRRCAAGGPPLSIIRLARVASNEAQWAGSRSNATNGTLRPPNFPGERKLKRGAIKLIMRLHLRGNPKNAKGKRLNHAIRGSKVRQTNIGVVRSIKPKRRTAHVIMSRKVECAPPKSDAQKSTILSNNLSCAASEF